MKDLVNKEWPNTICIRTEVKTNIAKNSTNEVVATQEIEGWRLVAMT